MAARLQNPSAGTQVVSLIEVRGTNNSLVHPRGAVGVVTRTPTGNDEHYLVWSVSRTALKPRSPATKSTC